MYGWLQKEEENFALYNYANELSSESDELQAEIRMLRDNIDEMSEREVQENKNWEETMHSVEVSSGDINWRHITNLLPSA